MAIPLKDCEQCSHYRGGYCYGFGTAKQVVSTAVAIMCTVYTPLGQVQIGPLNSLAGQLVEYQIPTGIISTIKLADLAVTSAKLADATVTALKIANAVITNVKIAAGAAIAESKLNLEFGTTTLNNLISTNIDDITVNEVAIAANAAAIILNDIDIAANLAAIILNDIDIAANLAAINILDTEYGAHDHSASDPTQVDFNDLLNKYTDAMAVAAVEAVSELNLTGYLDLLNNKSIRIDGVDDRRIMYFSGTPNRGIRYDAKGPGGGWIGAHRFYASANGEAVALIAIIDPDGLTINGDIAVTGDLIAGSDVKATDFIWTGATSGRLYVNGSTILIGSTTESDLTGSCTDATGISVHRITYDDIQASSSITGKENITAINEKTISESLDTLVAKEFSLKGLDERKIGFIAEDLPDYLISKDKDGKVESYSMDQLITAMFCRLKHKEKEITKLEERIIALEKRAD